MYLVAIIIAIVIALTVLVRVLRTDEDVLQSDLMDKYFAPYVLERYTTKTQEEK